jgi:HEAT repeat protein
MKGDSDPPPRQLYLWALEDIRLGQELTFVLPADARERLLAILRDEHATDADAYLAARLFCWLPRIDDQWVTDLLAVVQSDSPARIRATAAFALGPLLETARVEGFEDHAPVEEVLYDRIRDVLYEIHADCDAPTLLRRRALEALAHAEDDRLEQAIRAAYAADEDWRVTALRCMFHHDGFEAEIVESLESANLDIRSEALRAAVPCDLEEAWPCIRGVLGARSDHHKPLLLAAIGAIGEIHPEEAEDLLAPFVSSDDQEVARAARRTLVFVRRPLEHWTPDDDAPLH